MPITTRPSEKYAFLFAGTTSINTGAGDTKSQYREDLIKVYNMLKDYYGYPEDHIWVISGNENLLADYPNANYQTRTSKADLAIAFADFVSNAKVKESDLAATDLNSVLIYCTGVGAIETIINTPANANVSGLIIEGSAGEYIDGFWMKDQIDADSELPTNCFINIILDFSNSKGFYDDSYFELGVGTHKALDDCDANYASFTCSSQVGQNCATNEDGSEFTTDWVNAFCFAQITTVAHLGKTADLLDVSEPMDNLLISLKKSKQFAIEEGISTSPDFYPWGPDPAYLGLPAFLVRDGNPQWWESPDIYITNSQYPTSTDNDIYVADETNTIHINIKNSGTHPVRSFWMGHMVFFSGGGGAGIPEVINLTSATVLKANDSFPYTYVYNFPDTYTHRCIKAKARLTEIFALDIDTDNTDDIDWHVTDEKCEAQRNLDKYNPPPPPPEQPAPEPDNADMDEEIPEEAAEPDPEDEDNGSRSMRNIRGFKEHIYCIRNIFKKPHKFLIVFPEDYRDYKKYFRIEWFRMNDDLVNNLTHLEIVEKPYLHIPVKLEPGETMNILFYLALQPGVDFSKEIRLPFDILVDVDKDIMYQIKGKIRKTIFHELKSEYAPFSGITVVVSQGKGSAIIGRVTDRNNKPVPGSLVFIRTINERQSAVTMTNKEGLYFMPRINSDSYKLMAETDKWHTKKKTVFVSDGDKLELVFNEKEAIPGKNVKVILDKIRILNDHDPCLKGKGELVFTSFVSVDDNKPQVIRLPQEGVYKVSDKAGKNTIDLGVTIFEGAATKSLEIKIAGRELDKYDPDDDLNRYSRVFGGDMKKWYGKYYPGDEYHDKEDVGDWQIWYRIVRF